jgi:hypothetical protein
MEEKPNFVRYIDKAVNRKELTLLSIECNPEDILMEGVMKLSGIFELVVKYLPALISIAEGIFSWKAKSGEDKKAFVTDALKIAATGIAAESTGGQKETWDKIAPAVSVMIDASVELAKVSGVFEQEVGDTGLAGG